MDTLEGQECPVCHENTLTLLEEEQKIPGNGVAYVFGMKCDSCELEKGDVELEKPGPKKQELKIAAEKDLEKLVVRSGEATIKLPELKLKIGTDVGSRGYVGTAGDVVQEFIAYVKSEKDQEEDKKRRKKLFNQIDDLLDVQEGKKEITLVIEDPTGNSTIVQ